MVRGTIRDTGIDPHRIDIEITETAIIKDIAGAARVFASLRKHGVNVVLDDFGAGYSSLQILKSLPFDKIKIDRSLLQDVGRTAAADAIIGAILQLSRTLDLRVSAEGVETEEQLAVLRRERCDELQGFLIGSSMPDRRSLRSSSEARPRSAPDGRGDPGPLKPWRGGTPPNSGR